MELSILYEDNHLIVVVKPAGILAQQDYTNDPDMLSIVKQYIKDRYHKPGAVYLALVHRLDRMTEGIMVFGKTSKAASRLSEQISKREMHKAYYALCHGHIKNDEEQETYRLVSYLSKDEVNKKAYVDKNGKEAVLEYQIIKYLENATLIKVLLKTGRFHQIRAQMAQIGHPLVGDLLYGSTTKKPLALCAYELSFTHPTTGEKLTFTMTPSHQLLQ